MPRASKAKKLVLVSATSASLIGANKEAQEVIVVDRVPCIHYLIQFQKDKATIWALLNSGSEVNAMILAYAKQLGFQIQRTNVGAKKIDSSSLATYGMVIATFQMINKLGRAQFF